MIEGKKRSGDTEASAKRAWSAPGFADYGSVARLTLSGNFGGNDGNTKCTGNSGGTPDCAPSTS